MKPERNTALCVHFAVMALDATGCGAKRWIIRWKPDRNALDVAFNGRLSAVRKSNP